MSDSLKRIKEMADQLLNAEAELKRLQNQLEVAKANHKQIEQIDMPELMREVGLTSFTTEDERVITLEEVVMCGISAENNRAATKWLDEHGFGGLVKTVMVVDFNRDDREEALALASEFNEAAKGKGVRCTTMMNEKVHPSTLKSFVKEQMKKGANVPIDLFSIHTFSKAKVK